MSTPILSLRAVALGTALAAPALAQLPHTFVNGQVANANEVNANFTSVDGKANAAQTGVNTLRSDVDGLTGTVNLLSTGQTTSNGRITTLETGLNSLLAPLGPLTPFADRLAIHRRLSFEPSTAANRKVVLYQTTTDDHQFYGMGVTGDSINPISQFRYQVPGPNADHVFFAGASGSTSTELMRIKGDGRVRIGSFLVRTDPGGSTSGPQPTLVVGGGNSPTGNFFFEAGDRSVLGSSGEGNQLPGPPGQLQNVGIYVDHNIVAEAFWAKSDARIKDVKGHSDSAEDLATLMSIEVTDYQFIDTALHGSRSQKKVLGQQVETVFPQAVTRSTNVVPDVYRLAPVHDGWITLPTDLCKGEHVRLIGRHKDGLYEVLETRAGAFRTDFVPDDEQVFVYGREVQDFRTVDYEAIAMLNVSATQELARQLAAKDAAIEKLRADNEVLRGQFESLAKDLAQLKASFASK